MLGHVLRCADGVRNARDRFGPRPALAELWILFLSGQRTKEIVGKEMNMRVADRNITPKSFHL